MTTNIPQWEFFKYRKVPKDKAEQMARWAAARPEHGWDTAVNRSGRWSLIITDDGMFTTYALRDNSDKTIFEVPMSEEDMDP